MASLDPLAHAAAVEAFGDADIGNPTSGERLLALHRALVAYEGARGDPHALLRKYMRYVVACEGGDLVSSGRADYNEINFEPEEWAALQRVAQEAKEERRR